MQNQDLIKRYQKVKKIRKWMLQKAKSNSTDLDIVKADEKWSVNQLIYHLYIIEQSVLDYINYKKEKGELKKHKANFSTFWRSLLLKIALKLPLKFKVPKKVADFPNEIDFNQTEAAWENTQKEMEEFLKSFPKEWRGKEVFKHPRAGRITIEQTIDFIANHHHHHQKQMNRLLKDN